MKNLRHGFVFVVLALSLLAALPAMYGCEDILNTGDGEENTADGDSTDVANGDSTDVANGDDDINGESQPSDRPALPVPDSYIGSVPVKSDEMIIESVELSTFSPKIEAFVEAKSGEWIREGSSIDDENILTMTSKVMGIPNPVILVKDDAVVDSPVVPLVLMTTSWNGTMPNTYNATGKKAGSRPRLQLVRYWKKVGTEERYAGGVTQTIERSTTIGMSETQATESTTTLGVETSGGSSTPFVDFSVTVSAEFSQTTSFESTFSKEQTVTKTTEVSPELGTNIIYVMWQLVEEFRFVDASGNAYTDPNWEFVASSVSPVIINTSVMVPKTYVFQDQ